MKMGVAMNFYLSNDKLMLEQPQGKLVLKNILPKGPIKSIAATPVPQNQPLQLAPP